MNGISIFISVSYSPIWGYKKQAYYHPEGDPNQNPTMLAPWPRSSSPWNCEKYICIGYKSLVCGTLL